MLQCFIPVLLKNVTFKELAVFALECYENAQKVAVFIAHLVEELSFTLIP